MMNDPRKTVISGHKYEIYPLDAVTGYQLLLRIVKALGPGMAGMLKGVALEQIVSLDLRALKFDELLLGVVSNMDPHEYEAITMKLIDGLKRDDSPVIFQRDFQANYGELMSVLKWVLKENYGGLFPQGAAATASSVPAKG